jgi:tyrosine-protein phosphatase YwqE
VVNTQVSSQFRQEGDFKTMDEEVKEKLDKMRKLKQEITDLWVQESQSIEASTKYEEAIKEKQREFKQMADERSQLKAWF